jgi:hypothetical protein
MRVPSFRVRSGVVASLIIAAAAIPAFEQRWTPDRPLLSPRNSAAATLAGSRLHIAGGRDAAGGLLTLVESAPVDLTTGAIGTWRGEPPLAVAVDHVTLGSLVPQRRDDLD